MLIYFMDVDSSQMAVDSSRTAVDDSHMAVDDSHMAVETAMNVCICMYVWMYA